MKISSTKTFGFSILLLGFLLSGTGLWLLLSPAQYQATVRIKCEPDSGGGDTYLRGNDRVFYSYDPYFIQTELEIIRSPLVLSNVVESLNLNIKWAENSAMAIKFLQRQLNLQVISNTTDINISFSSDDPNEAATIANAISVAYMDYEIKKYEQITRGGIRVLTEQYQKAEQEINAKRENLKQLGKQLDLPNPEPVDKLSKSNYAAYFLAKQELQKLEDFHKVLATRIEEEKLNFQIPKTSLVQIVNAAKPPEFPVRPNRWLGAALLVVGLFPTVGGFLLLKSSCRQSF